MFDREITDSVPFRSLTEDRVFLEGQKSGVERVDILLVCPKPLIRSRRSLDRLRLKLGQTTLNVRERVKNKRKTEPS